MLAHCLPLQISISPLYPLGHEDLILEHNVRSDCN